ncbi:MAG: cytochrome c biogenesis protein ResB [Verrucomicrobiae bacterium]|nr:cytochrome c biogenesis protein ResB [Verrucomicrobiae bacterium]
MFEALYRIFTSLRLTVVLLALSAVLVFWGTLAQVPMGLYRAQNEFFRSFFIYWQPAGSTWKIPIFPGGYLLGGLLLINLLAAHTRYYQPGKKKIGIVFIHFGVVLLLVGQLLTDLLAVESTLHLRVGETKNYSESQRDYELAVVDVSEAESDFVVAIPDSLLRPGAEVRHPGLPFAIRVRRYCVNSALATNALPGFERVNTTAGLGRDLWLQELPHETVMDRRDVPTAIVEPVGGNGSLGTWLVSAFLARPQHFEFEGRHYEMSLRPRRYYKPFSIHLIEFKHERYPGTEIPKNFQSRVLLDHPARGERREVDIYMNNPLRYWGETYYQASYDRDDRGSVLQVVRNPGWLTPYFACVLVAVGMVIQFMTHLIPFLKRRLAV